MVDGKVRGLHQGNSTKCVSRAKDRDWGAFCFWRDLLRDSAAGSARPIWARNEFQPAHVWIINGTAELLLGLGISLGAVLTVSFRNGMFKIGQRELGTSTLMGIAAVYFSLLRLIFLFRIYVNIRGAHCENFGLLAVKGGVLRNIT